MSSQDARATQNLFSKGDPIGEWTLVQNKKYNKPKQSNGNPKTTSNVPSSVKNSKSALVKGTKVTSRLKISAQQPKTRALFVTRFDACVTNNEIIDYLKENGNLSPLNCVKLKTKFPGYSSFYILVNQNEYDLIANPSFWPEGVLYTQFYGKLKEDTVIHKDSVHQTNQPNDTSELACTRVCTEPSDECQSRTTNNTETINDGSK
jgi:hypothetical protein